MDQDKALPFHLMWSGTDFLKAVTAARNARIAQYNQHLDSVLASQGDIFDSCADGDIRKELIRAMCHAMQTAGCEVRVWAKTEAIASSYSRLLHTVLKEVDCLDSDLSSELQLELNNNSVILIGVTDV